MVHLGAGAIKEGQDEGSEPLRCDCAHAEARRHHVLVTWKDGAPPHESGVDGLKGMHSK